MKRLTILAILILTAAVFAVPQYLTYQGVLRDSSGNLVTGTKSMAFSIYDNATAGTQVYNQAAADISVSNGNYTVQLGPITTPTTVFSGGDRWLKVTVEGADLSPRLKINSVSYAIRAEVADSAASVASNAVTTASILNGAVTGEKLSPSINVSTTGDINITGTGKIQATNADITGKHLFITQISTVGAGCVGTGTIIAPARQVNITNPNYLDSLVFVTPTVRLGATFEALCVYDTSPGNNTFTVGLSGQDTVAPVDITFNYLIIN